MRCYRCEYDTAFLDYMASPSSATPGELPLALLPGASSPPPTVTGDCTQNSPHTKIPLDVSSLCALSVDWWLEEDSRSGMLTETLSTWPATITAKSGLNQVHWYLVVDYSRVCMICGHVIKCMHFSTTSFWLSCFKYMVLYGHGPQESQHAGHGVHGLGNLIMFLLCF